MPLIAATPFRRLFRLRHVAATCRLPRYYADRRRATLFDVMHAMSPYADISLTFSR